MRYSQQEYGEIRGDVSDYVRACEKGRFYEYFMQLNGIGLESEEARSAFKAEFFGKVFYTKNIEEENYLKVQLKEKYPTWYEAMFRIKGDTNYSQDYKNFPALMTEFETEIMFNTNMEVIGMGYEMVNIFDSLYSDSEAAIDEAKRLVRQKFGDLGLNPKFKDIRYRES